MIVLLLTESLVLMREEVRTVAYAVARLNQHCILNDGVLSLVKGWQLEFSLGLRVGLGNAHQINMLQVNVLSHSDLLGLVRLPQRLL